ncbi:hypothetical protein Q5690_28800 [Microcoleus sp. F10-D1]|uniref:hypothetical protein n=1 Tax=Microcoleus sp. F10-D1 TaxID=2818758 RepID=UPI002FD1F49D
MTKVVTVGPGHELYDRTRVIGTTYSLCHNRLGGCYTNRIWLAFRKSERQLPKIKLMLEFCKFQ